MNTINIEYQDSDTPLCNNEINNLRDKYDPLLLTMVFHFSRKLERQLRQANATIVDLHNQLETIEEQKLK